MDKDSVKLNFFNLENIIFQKKKIYHPDCENISIKYKPLNHSKVNEMNFNTSWMSTPFGVNSYNNIKKKKYYIDLSFNNRSKSIYVKQIYNIINKIDNYIPYLVENDEIPLIKRGALVDYTYIPIIKIIDKEPAIKLKIFPETVKIILTDTDDMSIPPGFQKRGSIRRDIPLEDVTNDYEIRAKIHCHSLWIMNKKYGLTWIAKELHIRKRKDVISRRISFIQRDAIKKLFHEEEDLITGKIYSKSI